MTNSADHRWQPDALPFAAPESPEDSVQILLSIRPQHVEDILAGSKTVEFRRKFPVTDRIRGASLWIYSTSPVQAVVGVATITEVVYMALDDLWKKYCRSGSIDRETFDAYFSNLDHGYAIELSGVTPLPDIVSATALMERGFNTPQSYRYVTADVFPLLRDSFDEAVDRYQRRDQA